ncbi:16949_t:CDS:2 [Funneliformis caledonium]|uniref:16949_t:CDS:1 n=1 Tax=Funneliformis caledonium TaxID=1117310 RepID=A0A9N8W623_9GLOM|nr:16949_t:CDS:2 [Funneliformis caledonium]
MTITDPREGFKNIAINYQKDTKKDIEIFEKKVEEVRNELVEMDEADIAKLVREKFANLNNSFIEKSNKMEEYVISNVPKKPEKVPNESLKESVKKNKAYKEQFNSYKEFVSWSMNIIDKLNKWFEQLFNEIIAFFKSLWNWIKAKVQDITTNVRKFVVTIANKFGQLCDYLFGKNK